MFEVIEEGSLISAIEMFLYPSVTVSIFGLWTKQSS